VTAEAVERTDACAYYGRVIIEWPAPGRSPALPGWGCSIFDADTGEPIVTVTRLKMPSVTVDAQDVITADLTMLADEDGMPVLGKVPQFIDIKDGEIPSGTFPFLVTEMRVRQ
jgi:hypothetical protein